MRASIVVLTYNHLQETTVPCIESLLQYTDLKKDELILVDNCSSDETPQYLQELASEHSDLRLSLNSENLGYAGGNNCGIEMAKGEFVILLNNDTLVSPGWIEKLCADFADPTVGMVGPISNSVGNHQVIDIPELDETNYIEVSEFYTSSISGLSYSSANLGFFCVAIRKSVIDEIGMLDADFGIGMFEDDEFCHRTKAHGYSLRVREDCFIYHKGSVSFKSLEQNLYHSQFRRNRDLYHEKTGEIWCYNSIARGFQNQVKIMTHMDAAGEYDAESLLRVIRYRSRFYEAILSQVHSIESKAYLERKPKPSRTDLLKSYLRKDKQLLLFRMLATLKKTIGRRTKLTALSLEDIAAIQKVSRSSEFQIVLSGVDYRFLKNRLKALRKSNNQAQVTTLFVSNCEWNDDPSGWTQIGDHLFVVNNSILNLLDHLCDWRNRKVVITDFESKGIPTIKCREKTVFENIGKLCRSLNGSV